ncbi:MAG: YihY/virulence factor BrkB family protein [Oscillospiraceae bacterium]|jgi:membrane protein
MSGFRAIIKDLADIYVRKRVSRSAAALAFYLTMTVFPLIACINALLVRTDLDRDALYNLLHGFLPAAALDALLDYISYVSLNESRAMFIGGLILLVTTSGSAFGTLTNTMVDIQGRGYFSGFVGTVFKYFFSLLFLIIIYISIIIVVTGRWFINLIDERLSLDGALDVWFWLRYILLSLLLFLMVFIIFRLTTRREAYGRHIFEGAVFSTIALVAVSIVYSNLINLSSKYSLVYGSLASTIVMMLWLQNCGVVLIMGNIYNFVRGNHSSD